MNDFTSYFRRATKTDDKPHGFDPYPYQIAFAESAALPELIPQWFAVMNSGEKSPGTRLSSAPVQMLQVPPETKPI